MLGTVEHPIGLFDLPAATNAKDMVTFSWSAKYAQGIAGFTRTPRARELRDAIHDTAAPVVAEIEALRLFRRYDPVTLLRRLVFVGMTSAHVHLDESVIAARQLEANMADFTAPEDVTDCLIVPWHGHGKLRLLNGWCTKRDALWRAMAEIKALRPEDMTREKLRTFHGIGPKIASFIVALWDADAPVFTLDTWMGRLTHALVERETHIKPSFSPAGYAVTEAEWLAFCQAQLPDLSPFAVQWAGWNLTRGYHASHLGLIAA